MFEGKYIFNQVCIYILMLVLRGTIFFPEKHDWRSQFCKELMISFFQGSTQVWQLEQFHGANGHSFKTFNWYYSHCEFPNTLSLHSQLKPWEALLCHSFCAAQPWRTTCDHVLKNLYPAVLFYFIFFVSFSCRPCDIIQNKSTDFTCNEYSFWWNCFMLGCYLLGWWVPQETSL